MSTNLTLTELDDRPELTVPIGGRDYRFSEVPVEKLADLDEFLRRTVPHPVVAIQPYLAGLTPADRQALLENARQDSRDWPPQAGTSKGMGELMRTDAGQLKALAAGLSVHHPELSAGQVARIYRQLQQQAVRDAARARRSGKESDGEGLVTRIFSVICGFGDPALRDPDEQPLPEACGPSPPASTGA